jgi:hypothetical protein
MRFVFIFLSVYLLPFFGVGQELYVFSEPASTLPAHAVSLKLKNHFAAQNALFSRFSFRTSPQVFFGAHRKLTIRVGGTLSNMYTYRTKMESAHVYAKYRFLSQDDVHRHFRMALYMGAATTSAPFHYQEINLGGDRSGVEAGLILTQLWHKLAVSGTVGHTQVLHPYRWELGQHAGQHAFQSLQANLAAGYLLFPRAYTSYEQTNLNFYVELLSQRLLDRSGYYMDVAPALQLIFASQTKLNLGYRFQVKGDMERMMQQGWLLSVETTLLGVLKKK